MRHLCHLDVPPPGPAFLQGARPAVLSSELSERSVQHKPFTSPLTLLLSLSIGLQHKQLVAVSKTACIDLPLSLPLNHPSQGESCCLELPPVHHHLPGQVQPCHLSFGCPSFPPCCLSLSPHCQPNSGLPDQLPSHIAPLLQHLRRSLLLLK